MLICMKSHSSHTLQQTHIDTQHAVTLGDVQVIQMWCCVQLKVQWDRKECTVGFGHTVGPLCCSTLPSSIVCRWKYLCLRVCVCGCMCVNCMCMYMITCMHTQADKPSLSCIHTSTHTCAPAYDP